jgi:hypothetical protein
MAEGIAESNGVTEESDLASLQQLSSGFESFNQVIADNIARAKSIIQEAAAARVQAAQDIADERARFEQEMAERRASFEAEVVAETSRLSGQRAQLLAAANAVLNNEWPEPAAPAAPAAAPAPASAASLAAPAAPAPVAAVEKPAADAAVVEDVAESAASAPAPADVAEEAEAAVLESAEPAAAAEDAAQAQPAPVAPPAEPAAPSEPTRTTVIVHGIHKPAIATGLQRFLLASDGVVQVEPREFAEGILRLMVRSSVPISEELFAGWSDGEGMTLIQRVPQTVEVILPSAV